MECSARRFRHVRFVAVVSVALSAGCIHAASAVVPALNVLPRQRAFNADRITTQTSISGIVTRGTTATDGEQLAGGYGMRFRSIRKGPFSLRRNSHEPKSPLLISTRLEGGTWGADGKYFTSGTTIGLAVGGRSWTFGFSAGAEYGGFRVSDWLIPVKAHFLYVGLTQLNVEVYAGKRYGEFADATAKVRGLVNAYGGTASIGIGGQTQRRDTHRRGIALGIFAERMDGVTVVGASLLLLGSEGRARATFLRDSEQLDQDQRNREEKMRVEVARLEFIKCENVISRLVNNTGRPYYAWLSINNTVTSGVAPLSAEMIRICKADAWSEALRTDIGSDGAQVDSIIALQPLLQQVQAFREGATTELEARQAEEERQAAIRAADQARREAEYVAAAAAEDRERTAQREATEREAAKPYVETDEDRKQAAKLAKELEAAVHLYRELVKESEDYAHHSLNRGMELTNMMVVMESYIQCLQYKPARGHYNTCMRPSFMVVW